MPLSAAEITAGYRRRLLQLRALTTADVLRLWPVVDYADLDGTFPTFSLGARAVIERDRATASALANLYLRAHRQAAGVEAPVKVIPPMPLSPARIETNLVVTGAVSVKRATLAGMTPESAMANALVQVTGASTRNVLNAARESVRFTSLADPSTVGWSRVTGGDACPFCRMVAGRGAVYSPETATFASHDHCSCSAQPEYGTASTAVSRYEPTNRVISEADRARTRDWIARNS